MITEPIITNEQIKRINKIYGGSLRSDAEIDTALTLGRGRSAFRKIAILWRAILVGHPFTDGNKRTALMVAITILERCNIKLEERKKENIVSDIKKIAAENITDIERIERMVRYVATGN